MSATRSEFYSRLKDQFTAWSLPLELIDEIESHLTPITFERGAVLFLRGSPADFLFWLLSGFVKVYLPHSDGNRTLIALGRSGDLLGFVDSVTPDGRREQILEAHALTKCSVGLFPRENLARLLRKLDASTMIRLLEHLNTTWSSMFEWYATFMGLPFRERLLLVFRHLGVRFGVAEKRGTLVLPELTHEDLAEMIGSSRPMVSRLVGDMVRDGLLVRGERLHFVLRDVALGPAARNGDGRPAIPAWGTTRAASNGAGGRPLYAREPLPVSAARDR